MKMIPNFLLRSRLKVMYKEAGIVSEELNKDKNHSRYELIELYHELVKTENIKEDTLKDEFKCSISESAKACITKMGYTGCYRCDEELKKDVAVLIVDSNDPNDYEVDYVEKVTCKMITFKMIGGLYKVGNSYYVLLK